MATTDIQNKAHQVSEPEAQHNKGINNVEAIAQPAPEVCGYFYQRRNQYHANGYDPIPIKPGEKYPADLSGWEQQEFLSMELYPCSGIGSWGIGVRTKQMPAIDIDVMDIVVEQQVRAKVSEMLPGGLQLLRIGMAPKSLIPCRLDGPAFKKITTAEYESGMIGAGGEPNKHKVEILADGQQYVAEHVHPDTGQPYQWDSDITPANVLLSDLPPLSLALAQRIADACDKILEAAGWTKVTKGKKGRQSIDRPKQPDNLEWLSEPDAYLDYLHDQGAVNNKVSPGKFNGNCIFADRHGNGKPDGMHYYRRGHQGGLVPSCYCSHAGCGDKNLIQEVIDHAHANGIELPPLTNGVSTPLEAFGGSQGAAVIVPSNPVDISGGPRPDLVPLFAPVDGGPPLLVYIEQFDKFYSTRNGIKYSPRVLSQNNPPAAGANTTTAQRAFFECYTRPGINRFNGVTYMPGAGWAVGDCLNTYRPSDLVPVRGLGVEDINPWWLLLCRLVPAEEEREHLLDWMAFVLQKPGIKINHAPLIMSPVHGVGKDTLIEPLIRGLGPHNCNAIMADSLQGAFNSYLIGTKLVIVEEIMDFIDKGKVANKIKPMLASPPYMLRVNEKNMPEFNIPNIVQAIFFSNNEGAMTIKDAERRYFCIRIEAELLIPEHATAIWQWYQQEQGFEKVFGWLLDRNVTRFDPQARPPVTDYQRDLVETSRTDLEQHIVEIIEADPVRYQVFPLSAITSKIFGVKGATNKAAGNVLRALRYEKTKNAIRHGDGERTRVWYAPGVTEAQAVEAIKRE